jgi:hypothetical protein
MDDSRNSYGISIFVKRKLMGELDTDGYDTLVYKLGQLLRSEECDIPESTKDKISEMLGEEYDRLLKARYYVSGLLDGINAVNGTSVDLAEVGLVEGEYGIEL